jgi:hypothetical protein
MITVRCRCKITKCARVKNKRGFDLISDAPPFGRLWYLEVTDAIDYAKFYNRVTLAPSEAVAELVAR